MITDLRRTPAGPTEKIDGITKSTRVTIGTIDFTYTGHIIHYGAERLIDVLNQGSAGDQPDLPVDFLQLQDVKICSVDGRKIPPSPNCLINKSGILFVGEKITEIDIPRNRSNLSIPKKPICVEVHLPSIFITAQIYIEPWQRLIGALNDNRRFLPLTRAIISSKPDAARIAEFEFVAVNRNQIYYLAKLD